MVVTSSAQGLDRVVDRIGDRAGDVLGDGRLHRQIAVGEAGQLVEEPQDRLLVPFGLLARRGPGPAAAPGPGRYSHAIATRIHGREHQQADHQQIPPPRRAADDARTRTLATGNAQRHAIELARGLVHEVQPVAERAGIAHPREHLVPGSREFAEGVYRARAANRFQIEVHVPALQAEHDLGDVDLCLPEGVGDDPSACRAR